MKHNLKNKLPALNGEIKEHNCSFMKAWSVVQLALDTLSELEITKPSLHLPPIHFYHAPKILQFWLNICKNLTLGFISAESIIVLH